MPHEMSPRAALLIVDVQNGFVNASSAHIPPRVEAIQNRYPLCIATKFINNPNSPYVRLIGWRGCMPGTKDVELAFRVAPTTKVVEKNTYTVVDKDFLGMLRSSDLSEVHICGIDTDICVMKCAIDLFENEVRPVVLANFCASHAGTEYHDIALRVLRRYIGERQIDVSSPAVLARSD